MKSSPGKGIRKFPNQRVYISSFYFYIPSILSQAVVANAWCWSFLFFSFLQLKLRPGVKWKLQLPPTPQPQPQPQWVQATSATSAAAWGNDRSLTQSRGIEPTSSQRQHCVFNLLSHYRSSRCCYFLCTVPPCRQLSCHIGISAFYIYLVECKAYGRME